jgi:hypothetical protein
MHNSSSVLMKRAAGTSALINTRSRPHALAAAPLFWLIFAVLASRVDAA